MKKIDIEDELSRILQEEINKVIEEEIPLKVREDNKEKEFNNIKEFLLKEDSLSEEQKNKLQNAKYIRKD